MLSNILFSDSMQKKCPAAKPANSLRFEVPARMSSLCSMFAAKTQDLVVLDHENCQIPQESVGLIGRGKLLSTTTQGEKHKTKMTKLQKQK